MKLEPCQTRMPSTVTLLKRPFFFQKSNNCFVPSSFTFPIPFFYLIVQQKFYSIGRKIISQTCSLNHSMQDTIKNCPRTNLFELLVWGWLLLEVTSQNFIKKKKGMKIILLSVRVPAFNKSRGTEWSSFCPLSFATPQAK